VTSTKRATQHRDQHKWIGVAVFGVALLGTLGCVCSLPTQLLKPTSTLPPTPTSAPLTAPPSTPGLEDTLWDAEERLLVDLYKRVGPSVVSIVVDRESDFEDSTGSGFIYDDEGHVVTNFHVVAGVDEVLVIFANDTEVAASVVGLDQDSDLAVLLLEDAPADLVRPVQLGDSSQVQVGQRAIAIGNPFGDFAQSMTVGIVSAVGRVVKSSRILPSSGSQFSNAELIQTDAAINPGNSGGPLFDSRGQVIGVNTLIRSSVQQSSGVGLAVPVNTVRRVVPALIARGYYPHPWLGIRGYSIGPFLVEELNLPVECGALVTEVDPEGPSEAAGVRGSDHEVPLDIPGHDEPVDFPAGGDIIVGIDGRPVGDMDDIITYLQSTKVGQTVVLKILREGKEIEIPVKLAERP
jgi:S1-C subfamily serine protease